MAGADQPLSADSFRHFPEAAIHPIKFYRQTGAAPCVLDVSRWWRQGHLQGLPSTWILVHKGHKRFLLFLDECKMSADRANNSVSDISIAIDADQRFDQAVVTEHMSAAQSPLCARETLITHRTLWCVLLTIFLRKFHWMTISHCSQLLTTSWILWKCRLNSLSAWQTSFIFGWARQELRLVKQGQPPLTAGPSLIGSPEDTTVQVAKLVCVSCSPYCTAC